MTAIPERLGQGIVGPDLRNSGLGRMDEPSVDQLPSVAGHEESSLGRSDDLVIGLARPSSTLTEPASIVTEIDPFTFTREEFSVLDPAMQREVSLVLMRQVPIHVLREGLKSGEERTPAQIQLETINPVLEIQYPISLSERLEFDAWERYIAKGRASIMESRLDTWDEVGITNLLDQERMRNEGKPIEGEEVQHSAVEGLKIGRYRRNLMQKQIEAELEAAARSEFQRAA